MIAPGKTIVHALLHHRPGAVESEKETVMIKLETILDRVVIDFGGEPAQINEGVGTAIQRIFLACGNNLAGSFSGSRAFAAGDDQAEFLLSAFEAFFERAAYRGGHAGRMPVKAENTTEGLEPVRIGYALEKCLGSVVFNYEAGNLAAQPDHSLK